MYTLCYVHFGARSPELGPFQAATGIALLAVLMLLGTAAIRSVVSASRNVKSLLASSESLVGVSLTLPMTDMLGTPLRELQGASVVVLSGCNSCSMDRHGVTKFPQVSGDAIFLTADSSSKDRLRRLVSARKERTWVVIDSRRQYGPPGLYDVPSILRLDRHGRVISARGVFD